MPGVDKEKEYEKLHKLFGIVDILEEDNTAKHVCSVSIYIPSDLGVNNKSVAYYTGIVKHIELFRHRIENPESSLLYIYYDAMFDADIDSFFFTYTDEESAPVNTGSITEMSMTAGKGVTVNNAVFTAARKRMSNETSSSQIVILIMLYRSLLNKIIEDRARYSHIRLFSYDCSRFKNKRNYFGHPEVFGSIVRFLPLYDTRLEQVTTLNGSHAMTPRLARILRIFGELPNRFVLSGFYNYLHRDYKYILELLKLGSYKEMYDNPESEEIRSVLFGGLSSIKPKELQMYSLYNILIPMITLYNKTRDPEVFKYGIDETLLTYIIILKDRRMSMSLLHEKVSDKKRGIDPGVYANAVINYLTTYDSKKSRLYPDIDSGRLSRFVSSEMTNTRRYNPLVLYNEDRLNTKIKPLFGEILSRDVIATLIDNASYSQNYTEFHAELDELLSNPDYHVDSINSTLETLLYGLDEPKPLYISLFDSPLISYPQIFTIIDPASYMVGDYSFDSIVEEVSNAVFSYYRDPEKVLRKPYEVTDRLNARLFSVDILDGNKSHPLSLNIGRIKGYKIHYYGVYPNSINNIYGSAPLLENLNSMLSAQNTGSRRQKPITKKVMMSRQHAGIVNNKNNTLKKNA